MVIIKNTMLTRNDLFRHYCQHDNALMLDIIIQAAFKSMSDYELAKAFNLRVLRRGYFVN